MDIVAREGRAWVVGVATEEIRRSYVDPAVVLGPSLAVLRPKYTFDVLRLKYPTLL